MYCSPYETTGGFIELQLHGDTLETSLNNFISPETLKGGNKVRCGHCGIRTEFTKTLLIDKISDVIIIGLKIFSRNQYNGVITKKSKQIQIPLQIEMQRFVTKITNQTYYDLQVVILHSGRTPDNGHYTAVARDIYWNNPNRWHLFNDKAVNEININNNGIFDFPNRQGTPYILIYKKRSVIPQIAMSEYLTRKIQTVVTNQQILVAVSILSDYNTNVCNIS